MHTKGPFMAGTSRKGNHAMSPSSRTWLRVQIHTELMHQLRIMAAEDGLKLNQFVEWMIATNPLRGRQKDNVSPWPKATNIPDPPTDVSR